VRVRGIRINILPFDTPQIAAGRFIHPPITVNVEVTT